MKRAMISLLTFCLLGFALVGADIAPASATAPQVGTPTESSPGSGTYNKLSYADGTIVTMSATNTNYFGGSQPMYQNQPDGNPGGGWWGGTGDYTNVYTPASIGSGNGLALTYRMGTGSNNAYCPGFTDAAAATWYTNYLSVGESALQNPMRCTGVGVITFEFSRPVTNALLSINNLGGARLFSWQSSPCAVNSSTKLSSMAATLNVTSGQSLEEVSSAGSFKVSSTSVGPKNVFEGLTNADLLNPAVPANGNCFSKSANLAPQTSLGRNYTGVGSGTVRVLGTYSTVTLGVDLNLWPRYYGSGVGEVAEDSNEGLSFQWSIPEIAPPTALPLAFTDFINTPQTYVVPQNVTVDAATTLVMSSLRLCTEVEAAATPVVCTQTKVTIDGEGTYEITDAATGTVTYTPATDFLGTVKKPVTYMMADALGQTAHSTITPTTIMKTQPAPTPTPDKAQEPVKPLNLPAKIKPSVKTKLVGHAVVTNADQNAKVRVSCVPASTLLPRGDVSRCTVTRTKSGKVSVKVQSTPTRVTVRVSAPAVPGYTAYSSTKSYLVR